MACRAYLVFLRAHMRRGLQVSLASSLDAVCAIRTLCEIQQEPQCRDVFVLLIMMASRWPSAKSCARVNDSLWDKPGRVRGTWWKLCIAGWYEERAFACREKKCYVQIWLESNLDNVNTLCAGGGRVYAVHSKTTKQSEPSDRLSP